MVQNRCKSLIFNKKQPLLFFFHPMESDDIPMKLLSLEMPILDGHLKKNSWIRIHMYTYNHLGNYTEMTKKITKIET